MLRLFQALYHHVAELNEDIQRVEFSSDFDYLTPVLSCHQPQEASLPRLQEVLP
jgi:hypothetical protein